MTPPNDDVVSDQVTFYTVSRLNRETRALLNGHFGLVWVQGEVSNLMIAASGHCYFSLRDAEAQVRCAMFRGQARALTSPLQNGDEILVKAQVSLYEPRGDYQLIIDYLEPIGDGALRRAFDVLKQRLAAEGLFDAAHKKPIPILPRCIGVITSPTGAAIHDILTVLKRRFPAIPVIVFPTKVQGPEAKGEIVEALAAADRSGLCDVLLLTRGGGSLEDLWPFNEESVARAIHRCRTPVVSGVGHEVDFTISDLVADLRAPTPSAAAEAVSPDAREFLSTCQRREKNLRQRIIEVLQKHEQRLAFIGKRLEQAHPQKRIQTQVQRVDELMLRLQRAMAAWVGQRNGQLDAQTHRLLRHHPGPTLILLESRRQSLDRRLHRDLAHGLDVHRARLHALEERLTSVSPLATLARGYAAVMRVRDGLLVKSAQDIAPGDTTMTRLAQGSLTSTVEAVHPEP